MEQATLNEMSRAIGRIEGSVGQVKSSVKDIHNELFDKDGRGVVKRLSDVEYGHATIKSLCDKHHKNDKNKSDMKIGFIVTVCTGVTTAVVIMAVKLIWG